MPYAATTRPFWQISFPEPFGRREFEAALRFAGVDVRRPPSDALFDHRRCNFIPIDVLAAMLCLYNRLAHQGVRVLVYWEATSDTFSYAERVGFFAALDPRVLVVPERPDEVTGRYSIHRRQNPELLELTSVSTDLLARNEAMRSLMERLSLNLEGLDDAQNAVGRIMTCASEAVENIVDHSETPVPGLIAVQRYRRSVRLVIADAGLGLTSTIRAARSSEAHRPDAAIILDAFAKGLSQHSDPGRGSGLVRCAEVVQTYRGRLRVRTGHSEVALLTNRDGVALDVSDETAAFLAGTHIVFDLPVDKGPN